MSLIRIAGLMKTVTQVGRCYESLVKEFIINVGPEVSKPGHADYFKVCVRGQSVEFSLVVINKFLGRSEEVVNEEQVSLESIVKELTANQVTQWPTTGTIPCSKLNVKYAILHKIGAANWAPSSHTSSVPASMARLIYAIGTKSAIDFGAYVFDQTMKHGDSFAIKMPISLPCLLTELILSQHPDLLRADEKEAPKSKPLNFDYRLFIGTHVNDIEIPSARNSGHSGSVPRSMKESILSELIATSKTLQNTIRISTEQKLKIDKLIQQIMQEQAEEGAEDQAEDVEAEDQEAAKGKEGGSTEEEGEESSVDEEGSAEENEASDDEEESATASDDD